MRRRTNPLRLRAIAWWVLLACALAGCVDDARAPNRTTVFLEPGVASDRFVELREEDAENPALRRLIEEIRAAKGEPATFQVNTEDSEAMMAELSARWVPQHGKLGPVVVRYSQWNYSVIQSG